MSEEILYALAQLYGIITKQDGGVTIKERDYVIRSFQKKLNEDSVQAFIDIYDSYAPTHQSGHVQSSHDAVTKTITVKDSVLTLSICNKINKILTQKQKIIVVLELYELIKADEKFTPQRMAVINTVSSAFNIAQEDIKTLEYFILNDTLEEAGHSNILIVNKNNYINSAHHDSLLNFKDLEGNFIFVYIRSANIILFKFENHESVYLNGIQIESKSIHLFTQGATVKSPLGVYLYYSDIQAHFRSELKTPPIVLNAINVSYQFSKIKYGLRNINISESTGKLIGIMGSSGSGKTTLLNVLAGIETPSSGKVTVNGIDINKEKLSIQSLIGYISQDDLLIEELTVYQNLFFNTQLTFKNLNKEEVDRVVFRTLENLGLSTIHSLQVGSVFNKKISGGQRKRLNIALELIREPAILFVDEPTSGLSSRDSENVIDLLKELTLKGKLIFVVIHQPSSDVYKMFDKIMLLDTGGYSIYYGPPVEAVSYLKRISKQVDREKDQCDCCGNVNPEQIFNIIEEKVVDEFGNLTEKRKKNPAQWNVHFEKNFPSVFDSTIRELPSKIINTPSRLRQWMVFTKRDLFTKANNKQYLIINLFEAPVLAFFLAIIIRYKNNPGLTKYVFRFNENLPAYILMSIVVAIFIGLSISAEEIIKDKKNLKRESFLNLSRSSYLFSKLAILFSISAFQTLLFVLIGNSILEIKGMTLEYWAMLFSTACMANILGLIISSAFSTPVAVYILIPLLLIPQMILSGAMFNFEKLNEVIKSSDDIPIMADLMGSRWAFEGLAVEQFKNNAYEKKFYSVEQIENISNFNLVYLLPELKSRLWFIENHYKTKDPVLKEKIKKSFAVLSNEFAKQIQIDNSIDPAILAELKNQSFSPSVKIEAHEYIDQLKDIYRKIFLNSSRRKEKMINALEHNNDQNLNHLKDDYFNETLSDLVRNINTKNRILEVDSKLIPKTELIFFNPIDVSGHFDYRSHFFSPEKHIFGIGLNTYTFNICMVWIISFFLFIALYFDFLKIILTNIQKLIVLK